jgi:hypothetical protein
MTGTRLRWTILLELYTSWCRCEVWIRFTRVADQSTADVWRLKLHISHTRQGLKICHPIVAGELFGVPANGLTHSTQLALWLAVYGDARGDSLSCCLRVLTFVARGFFVQYSLAQCTDGLFRASCHTDCSSKTYVADP